MCVGMDTTTKTAEKTWEQHLQDARADVLSATPETLPARLVRAELLEDLEQSHRRAIRQALWLATNVQSLLRELETDGMAANGSGNNFLAGAQETHDAMLALDHSRKAFRVALLIERGRAKTE